MSRRRRRRSAPLLTCEMCRERKPVRKWLIDPAQGDTPRNRVLLCEGDAAAAQSGWVTPEQLQDLADEREDRAVRELMGHAAFRRDGGAVRQIRDR